jgi:hypothetical protein
LCRNLVFLDRGSHTLPGGTVVLGATLWSDVLPEQANDVRFFLSGTRTTAATRWCAACGC